MVKKGYKQPPEHAAKCRLYLERARLRITPEVIARRSKTQTGHSVSEETRRKIGLANRGRKFGPHSDEWKKKVSLANKGKVMYIESRKKMSIARKGKPLSEKQ